MQFEVKYQWSSHYSALTGVKCEFVQHHRGGFWNSNMFEGGACFNSEYFWGKKTEALTAAASYQELAGFFMLAQALMGHLCIYQAGNMKE